MICFTRKGTGSTPIYPRTAPKPTPFAYQSNKAVPWKYTPPAFSERVATEVDSLSAKVTNITGLSGITRSGRVFASPHPAELPSKGKAPMIQEPTDVATSSKEVDPPVVKGAEKKEGFQGNTVTLEEACRTAGHDICQGLASGSGIKGMSHIISMIHMQQ